MWVEHNIWQRYIITMTKPISILIFSKTFQTHSVIHDKNLFPRHGNKEMSVLPTIAKSWHASCKIQYLERRHESKLTGLNGGYELHRGRAQNCSGFSFVEPSDIFNGQTHGLIIRQRKIKPEESGIAVAKIENKARVNLSSLTILAWCVSRFNYAPHIIPYGKSNEDKSFFRFISSPLTRWKKNVI